MNYDVLIDGHLHRVEVERTEQGFACKVDGDIFNLDVAAVGRDVLSILQEGRSYEARRECMPGGETHILIGPERFRAEVRDPRSLRSRRRALGGEAGPVEIHAPMPGKIVRLIAAQGDEVEAGQALLVVEAMKMQNEIRAPKKGKVARIAVQEASAVNAGDLLAVIE
jgi:biotin carboxyl carrier protein